MSENEHEGADTGEADDLDLSEVEEEEALLDPGAPPDADDTELPTEPPDKS